MTSYLNYSSDCTLAPPSRMSNLIYLLEESRLSTPYEQLFLDGGFFPPAELISNLEFLESELWELKNILAQAKRGQLAQTLFQRDTLLYQIAAAAAEVEGAKEAIVNWARNEDFAKAGTELAVWTEEQETLLSAAELESAVEEFAEGGSSYSEGRSGSSIEDSIDYYGSSSLDGSMCTWASDELSEDLDETKCSDSQGSISASGASARVVGNLGLDNWDTDDDYLIL